MKKKILELSNDELKIIINHLNEITQTHEYMPETCKLLKYLEDIEKMTYSDCNSQYYGL